MQTDLASRATVFTATYRRPSHTTGMSLYGPQSNPRMWHWPSWEKSHEPGTWGWPAVLLHWLKLWLPWHGHPGRQMLRPL